MSELYTEVNQEWLTLQEAALLKQVTPSAISHALSKHPEIKEKYTKSTGRRLYISKEGYLVLFNVQNQAQGGVNNDERALTPIQPIKQKIAELGIEAMKDPIIMMRIEAMKLEKRVDLIEQRLDTQPQLIDDYLDPAKKLTPSQQKMLSERVKGLAYGLYGSPTGAHFAAVWNGLHNYTGKKQVSEYTMEDYDAGRYWLKKKYQELNLSW